MTAPLPARAQVRDAITPRTVALVLGVLLLQLGFIASYLGAFHAPSPHRVPVAVVAPAGAAQVAAQLDQLPGEPLDARVAASEGAARRLIDDRTVDAAVVAGPDGRDRLLVAGAEGGALTQALISIATQVEQQQRRTFTVEDVRPAAAGDARGLSPFYLVVGWTVGGYLVASLLGIAAGTRPASPVRVGVRLAALAGYALASGALGTVVAEAWVGALSGHGVALALVGALLVFGVGAATMALQIAAGTAGIGLTILLFVVLGNPSAGGAYPGRLLPSFWRAIGPWLPPGAGTSAVRGLVYFDGAGTAFPLLVLAGYALVGTAVAGAFAGVLRRRVRQHHEPSALIDA